jgi:hypothetical protein
VNYNSPLLPKANFLVFQKKLYYNAHHAFYILCDIINNKHSIYIPVKRLYNGSKRFLTSSILKLSIKNVVTNIYNFIMVLLSTSTCFDANSTPIVAVYDFSKVSLV